MKICMGISVMRRNRILKQEKTIKLWQVIVMECLLLAIFITMFIPMFNFSGSSMIKGTKEVFQKMDLDKLGLDDTALDASFQQIADELDKGINKYEEEHNVNISRISPWKIMTKSFVGFLYGDTQENSDMIEDMKDNEMAGALQSGYNSLKYLFWVVYIVLVLIIILNIVGFIVKFVKYISLGINIAYGLFTIGVFSYLRFGVIGATVKQSEDMIDAMGLGYMASYVDIKVLVKSILSGLYFKPFMILILAASMLIVLCSIVFMFIGKDDTGSVQSDFQEASFGSMQGSQLFGNMQSDFDNESYGKVENDFHEETIGMMENDFHEETFGMMENDFDDQFFGTIQNDIENQPVETMQNNGQESSMDTMTDVYQDQVTVPMTENHSQTANSIPVKQPMGRVCVIKGSAKGQGFMLPQNRKVVVGKSMQNANLIINNIHVSNIHCSIRYNEENDSYIVKDHSSNGTFVNGIRLQKNAAMEYPSGTVLSLADGQDEIQLG